MCTLEKQGNIFFLILTGDGDEENCLNDALIFSIRSALSKAKSQSAPGSVLVTIAQGKFFSNGGDLNFIKSTANGSSSQAIDIFLHSIDLLKSLIADFISFPMPTIAAVTGHAAGGGMLLALSHDYILMRRDRGIMYMVELELGISLPGFATELIKSKVGKPESWRDISLRAVKVKAEEGVAMGLVHSAHDGVEKTVEAAVYMAEELGMRKWDGEVYVETRKQLYRELCGMLGLVPKLVLKPRL